TKRIQNFAHGCLSRATTQGVRSIAIHPVFGDVDVQTAQINRAKLIEDMINLVKFERFIGRATIGNHLMQTLQDPAIDQGSCSGGLRPPIVRRAWISALIERRYSLRM